MFIDLKNGSLTVEKAAELCGGILTRAEDKGIRVCCVCTDSREARPGSLFLCIRGSRVDGHRFAKSAADLGASAVIAEELTPEVCDAGVPVILADNTIAALGRLAKNLAAGTIEHRVAVTGSVGKTTTKEMIATVLSGRGCFRTEGNFNSTVGMPMSLLTVPAGTHYAVFEFGLTFDIGFRNHHQIDAMSGIVKPEIAVVTNVGTSHMEHFRDRAELIEEKLSVSDGMTPGGTLICSAELYREASGYFSSHRNIKTLTFSVNGDKDAGARAENINEYPFGQTFDAVINGHRIENIDIRLYGIHNVQASLIAAAVGHIFGLEDEEIRRTLAAYKPYSMRQEIIRAGGVTVINDCYNASPESMRAACDVLCGSGVGAQRRLALLGDMLELGLGSEEFHRSTGRYFAEKGLDYLFAFGQSSRFTAEGAALAMDKNKIKLFEDKTDAGGPTEAICSIIREGDALLIKASRGMEAERITAGVVSYLRSRENRKGEV